MSMSAWVVQRPAAIDDGPLSRVERSVPDPGPGQVRVRVTTCGVCRTDLHLAEGDLAPKHAQITPGHEIVGVVEERGEGAERFEIGQRIGVPWLGGVDGTCTFCRSGRENLCEHPTFTGWDVDGGYADACVVDEAFAYALPDGLEDEQAPAMAALDRGGTLAVAGIHLSDVPSLNYQQHLFEERVLRSVTANTRVDGEQFLRLAERFGIRATTHGYSMDDAPRALTDLEHGRFDGAAVLHN